MPPAATAVERRTTTPPARRHYDRAPIQEASISVGVELPEGSTAEQLLRVREAHVARYPEAHALIEGKQARTTGHEFRGEGTMFRARLDGFSFHRLAPYTAWEEWTPQAFEMWERYAQTMSPRAVARMGVRYVNRLEFPAPTELKEYLLTAPDVAPGLPQLVSSYVMQLTLRHQRPDTFVLMRQATVGSDRPDAVALLLDIEAVRTVRMEPRIDLIRAVSAELHEIEIETFERSITNRTRELIG
jgi:uncharacterized protein (TIGR04255 family)